MKGTVLGITNGLVFNRMFEELQVDAVEIVGLAPTTFDEEALKQVEKGQWEAAPFKKPVTP